jgi:hypothetical protein
VVVLSLEGPFAAPIPHAPPRAAGPVSQRQVKVYPTPMTRFEDGRCGERLARGIATPPSRGPRGPEEAPDLAHHQEWTMVCNARSWREASAQLLRLRGKGTQEK